MTTAKDSSALLHWLWEPGPKISDALVVDEVTALMRYASEQGIDQSGAIIGPLNAALCEYRRADPDSRGEHVGKILSHYAILTALTKPVNGRTLLDTHRANRKLSLLTIVSIAFLLTGMGISMLGAWLANQPEPEEGMALTLSLVHQHVLSIIDPFVQGALGACVYLLKMLYDIAADRQFDNERLHGWWLRLLLGGVMGLAECRGARPVGRHSLRDRESSGPGSLHGVSRGRGNRL
jgi:hypothetical protein